MSAKYDVIIVGAGSSGCVLACRLSEGISRKVLLVEAGPDYPDISTLPADISNANRPTLTHDWGYSSQPIRTGRILRLPRARIVGGCSATNAVFALRGSPGIYDKWEKEGNRDCSFRSLLPFFCKLEHDENFDDEWHGKNGPITISRYKGNEFTPVHKAFLEVCTKKGIKFIKDHNKPGETGAGLAPQNVLNGIRQSAAITYLEEARRRPNLTIRSGVLVNRVLADGSRIEGIQMADPVEKIYGERVIIAAGSYGSPAILMRSGIGPADHLRSLEIKVVVDLPGVGNNLIDHPLLGLLFAAKPEDAEENVPVFQTMLTARSSKEKQDYDIMIMPMSISPAKPELSPTGFFFIVFASLMKPHSMGQIKLSSLNPADPPLIEPGYFSNPDDITRMIEAVKIAYSITKTPPLSDFVVSEIFPKEIDWNNNSDIESAIWSRLETYHHPVGTCRMGKEEDRMSVVDSFGKIHGIEGLSIVDASIFPSIPNANTNLPVIMMAERSAEKLKL